MSSFVSGSSGGQPSTTQPIAIPWLSPKVVTRNMWPKVLKDMVLIGVSLACGNARDGDGQTLLRHARACPGHPRPSFRKRLRRGWPGIGERKRRRPSGRLCPAMTTGRGSPPLTILPQTPVAEHIDGALLDGQVGRTCGGFDAERHHQRPRGAAMRDRYRV